MLKTHLSGNHGCNVNVKAERPIHKKPEIVETYYDADGVRMYESKDNKHYIADVLDRIFDPIKTPVIRKGYKARRGESLKILLY